MKSRHRWNWLLATLAAASLACGEVDSTAPDGSSGPDGGGGTQVEEDGGVDAGHVENPDGGTVSFATHVAPIFNATCTGYCHPGGYSPMSLRQEDALDTLVGVDSIGCTDGRLRVLPGDPDPTKSYLMAKLTGEHMCSGGVMPPSGALSEEQLGIVRAWIEGGAQP